MIEVEIEDAAWTAVLPDAEAACIRAATAALAHLDSLPQASGEADHPRGEGEPGAPPQSLREGSPASGEAEDADDIAILLTDDAGIAELNTDFRDKPGPTNVLSFPAHPSAAPHLGDLALAHGVCAREAAEQGKSLADHLAHLVVHGVLHLVGYDHEDDAEAEEMEAMERSILAGLGVADPYASEGAGRETDVHR